MEAAENTLAIRFLPLQGDEYQTVFSGFNGGSMKGTFKLPFTAPTRRAVAQLLEPGFSIDAVEDDAVHAALAPLGNLFELRHIDLVQQRIGDALMKGLLSASDLQQQWNEALAKAVTAKQPLAVTLCFAPEAAALAALPWELLHHQDRFLVSDTTISLSRNLENCSRMETSALAELPLRVLLVLPEPLDTPSVLSDEARTELLHGLRTLDEAGAVFVDLLRPPTYDILIEAVRNGGYHVMVFYGHGVTDSQEGSWLLFEDEYGGQARVHASELGAVLRNTSICLVLLAACQSAEVGATGKRDVGMAVAPALLHAGVPLTIGMQVSMRADAALAFIRQFALSLAKGKPVVEVMADARLPLIPADKGTSWFIPALYGWPRTDTRLFDPAQALPAETADLRAEMARLWTEIARMEQRVGQVRVLEQAEEITGLRQARAAFAQARAELARRTPGGYAVVTSPLYGVPSNPIFVGRSYEVQECGRKLKDTHPLVIWGVSGIGKTALAAEVAHRQGWRFPAGVLWLDCRGGPALDTLLDRIGAFAGVVGIAQVEPDTKISTVRFALAGLEDRCLLAWDNAEDVWGERSVSEFVQGLPANCQVLLTTRENPEVPMWQVLELSPLPDQAIRELFDRMAVSAGVKLGTLEDLDIIPPMLDWLQGHPLAVTLVVPLVAKRGLRRVWDDLRRQPLKGVAAAFEVSYGRLTALQKRIFTHASVYAIPVHWEAIEALLPGKSQVDEALDVLVQRALVGFDGSSYSYHALLRQYAYAKLQANKNIRSVHRLAAGYLQSLAKERTPTPEEVLEEVDQWGRAEAWEEFAQRSSDLVGSLDRLGFWAEIQGRLERALAAVREQLGAPTELHGQVLNALASIHLTRADWDIAEKLWQEALVVHQAVDDEFGLAVTLSNLGNVYADKGEWDRAIEFYQQSLATFERLGDIHGLAQTHNNLGLTYADKGEWDRAIEFYQQSLATKERLGDIHGLAQTLGNLGSAYARKGEWDRAIELYQQSLATKERLGDIHGLAQTLMGLGNAYADKGEWDRAIELYQQSLTTFERLGDIHGLAQTLGNLGSLYWNQDKQDEAVSVMAQAYVIFAQLGAVPEARQAVGALVDWLGSVEAANAYLMPLMQLTSQRS